MIKLPHTWFINPIINFLKSTGFVNASNVFVFKGVLNFELSSGLFNIGVTRRISSIKSDVQCT